MFLNKISYGKIKLGYLTIILKTCNEHYLILSVFFLLNYKINSNVKIQKAQEVNFHLKKEMLELTDDNVYMLHSPKYTFYLWFLFRSLLNMTYFFKEKWG